MAQQRCWLSTTTTGLPKSIRKAAVSVPGTVPPSKHLSHPFLRSTSAVNGLNYRSLSTATTTMATVQRPTSTSSRGGYHPGAYFAGGGNILGWGRSVVASPLTIVPTTTTTMMIRAFSKNKQEKQKKNKQKSLNKNNKNDQQQQQQPETPSKQLEGWIEFQKSIAVEGFETGQTVDFQRKSTRGGKRFSQRKSKEQIRLEERIKERQRMTDVGGGEFPPLRYSDEETERLLAQAYAAIPPRTGKRGTRNLKRQRRRWRLVREIRKKYKKNIIRAHERRMMERSRQVKAVKAILSAAPDVRFKDKAYQLQILERWMATTRSGPKNPQQQQPLLGSSSDAS